MNDIYFSPPGHARRYRRMVKNMLWSAAGACGFGGLYIGRLETHWLRIEHLDMPLRSLGAEFEGCRIAHISDLHCSPLVRERYLRQCVDRINAMHVDFVAVTGDLITGPKPYARRVSRVLGRLTPKVATLVCLGNHDYGVWHPKVTGGRRSHADYLSEQLAFSDVFVMNNESRLFRRGRSSLQFVGVEDYWTDHYNPPLAFEQTHRHIPTIALCHNPDGAHDMVAHGAQWVLAGHTHGTPKGMTKLHNFVLPVECRHMVAGKYCLGGGNHLYVNRGLSYARRVNLNARPEITVFTLRTARPAAAAS